MVERISDARREPNTPGGPRAARNQRRVAGFTLIEIAIVLVLIGLLLGGVLKGQELMTGARARGIIRQQSEVQSAFYGFYDRYRAYPGDYPNAVAMITGVGQTCGVAGNLGNGNANGRVEIANGEHLLLWEHLSRAGFLTVSYTCTGNAAVTPGSTPTNAFGQFVQVAYDNQYAGAVQLQHNFKTGNGMPSELLAEIDRKVDDGNAMRGILRGSTFTSSLPTDAGCWDAASGRWSVQPGFPNCGAALLY